MRIVLVSSSLRRRELISYLGVKVHALFPKESAVEEYTAADLDGVGRLVVKNAKNKVLSVLEEYPNDILIGADTLVFGANMVFSKPKTKEEAVNFLKILSRNPHWVCTGIYLCWGKRYKEGVEKTKVYMDPINEVDIVAYVEKEQPLDKAGGFGIQGMAGMFINRIEGCFYNVVGLPLALLRKLLLDIVGINSIVELSELVTTESSDVL